MAVLHFLMVSLQPLTLPSGPGNLNSTAIDNVMYIVLHEDLLTIIIPMSNMFCNTLHSYLSLFQILLKLQKNEMTSKNA